MKIEIDETTADIALELIADRQKDGVIPRLDRARKVLNLGKAEALRRELENASEARDRTPWPFLVSKQAG